MSDKGSPVVVTGFRTFLLLLSVAACGVECDVEDARRVGWLGNFVDTGYLHCTILLRILVGAISERQWYTYFQRGPQGLIYQQNEPRMMAEITSNQIRSFFISML